MSESKQTKRTKTKGHTPVAEGSPQSASYQNVRAKNHRKAASSRRGVKAYQTHTPYPTEDQEQVALAKYLDARFGYYGWIHVPNQRWAKPQYLRKLNAMGVKRGFPDILILEEAIITHKGGIGGEPILKYKGMAIELKRQNGGRVTASQEEWLCRLVARDIIAMEAFGAQDAINKIEEVYGK